MRRGRGGDGGYDRVAPRVRGAGGGGEVGGHSGEGVGSDACCASVAALGFARARPGWGDREGHTHRAVTDDRAPAFDGFSDDSGLEHGGVAWVEARRVWARGENEVVSIRGIDVADLDFESVTRRHLERVRNEAHVGIRLDLEARRATGRGDGGARTVRVLGPSGGVSDGRRACKGAVESAPDRGKGEHGPYASECAREVAPVERGRFTAGLRFMPTSGSWARARGSGSRGRAARCRLLGCFGCPDPRHSKLRRALLELEAFAQIHLDHAEHEDDERREYDKRHRRHENARDRAELARRERAERESTKERLANRAGDAREREHAKCKIERNDAEDCPAAHHSEARLESTRASTHRGRQKVAHRAQEKLQEEARDEGDAQIVEACRGEREVEGRGDRGTVGTADRAEPQPPQRHARAEKPQRGRADREHGEEGERLAAGLLSRLSRKRHEERAEDDLTENVEGEAREPHEDVVDERTEHRDERADHHDDEETRGARGFHRIELRAQDRGPEREQRRRNRDAHETEDVDDLMSEEQAPLPRFAGGEGEDCAERCTEGKEARGNEVGPHDERETRGEGCLELRAKRKGIPEDHGAHADGTEHREVREIREHARHREHDRRREAPNAPHLRRAGFLGEASLKERLREVLAPNHDRCRHEAERHHVHEKPPELWDERMRGDGDHERDHPIGDGFRGLPVPAAAGEAFGAILGRVQG